MRSNDTTMVSFYQLMGRVFFAVAQADKRIEPEEVAALKQIVKDAWLEVDDTTDEFDTDAAFQIEIVFDYLLNNDVIENDVLDDLKEFKSVHPSIFTHRMIELIMETAFKIASSFARRNKSELVFISRLKLLLTN